MLTLTNTITGFTLSYALRKPHVIQDVPWVAVLDGLRGLDDWSPEDRLGLFRIFAADQFTRGMPCGVCWNVTGLSLRLMRDRDDRHRLFRAATCSHEGPGDEYMCCICGNPLKRAMSRDEYGPYDAVGCACPTLAFDVEYDVEPWREAVSLAGPEAAAMFERA